MLHGLKKADLNGKTGTVVSYDPARDPPRYAVDLHDDEPPRLLKAEVRTTIAITLTGFVAVAVLLPLCTTFFPCVDRTCGMLGPVASRMGTLISTVMMATAAAELESTQPSNRWTTRAA